VSAYTHAKVGSNLVARPIISTHREIIHPAPPDRLGEKHDNLQIANLELS